VVKDVLAAIAVAVPTASCLYDAETTPIFPSHTIEVATPKASTVAAEAGRVTVEPTLIAEAVADPIVKLEAFLHPSIGE